mgnify:CR=1 FL=1
MIRHHHPRPEPITLTVEVEQGILNDLCCFRMPEDATTVSGIQQGVVLQLSLLLFPVFGKIGEFCLQKVER